MRIRFAAHVSRFGAAPRAVALVTALVTALITAIVTALAATPTASAASPAFPYRENAAGSAASSATAPHALPAPAAGLRPVVRAAAERVLIADKVAAAKYGTDSPIEDPVREQQVLDAMAARGEQLGLDPADVRRVFRDQIEANKLVQRALYRLWDSGVSSPPAERPSLPDIRREIDRTNGELLDALVSARRARGAHACHGRLLQAQRSVAHELKLDALHAAALSRAVPSICSCGAPDAAGRISPRYSTSRA